MATLSQAAILEEMESSSSHITSQNITSLVTSQSSSSLVCRRKSRIPRFKSTNAPSIKPNNLRKSASSPAVPKSATNYVVPKPVVKPSSNKCQSSVRKSSECASSPDTESLPYSPVHRSLSTPVQRCPNNPIRRSLSTPSRKYMSSNSPTTPAAAKQPRVAPIHKSGYTPSLNRSVSFPHKNREMKPTLSSIQKSKLNRSQSSSQQLKLNRSSSSNHLSHDTDCSSTITPQSSRRLSAPKSSSERQVVTFTTSLQRLTSATLETKTRSASAPNNQSRNKVEFFIFNFLFYLLIDLDLS